MISCDALKKILLLVGVVGIVFLETVNLLLSKFDGFLMSACVGMIAYIVTGVYYRNKNKRSLKRIKGW